jgi:hypothetical protein
METLKVNEESPNTLVKMKKGLGRPKKSEGYNILVLYRHALLE